MGVYFFLFFMMSLLPPPIILLLIRWKVRNRKIKKILGFISVLFLAMPVSWIVFMVYIWIFDNMSISVRLGMPSIFIFNNLLGILIYSIKTFAVPSLLSKKKQMIELTHVMGSDSATSLHEKRVQSFSLRSFLYFLLCLNILLNTFSVILMLME